MNVRLLLLAFMALSVTAFASPTTVDNGSEPAEGLKVLQLEELWRAGGADDEVIFGHIFRAEGDTEGNVYLLDTQLSEVPVFAPDGTLVKTLSREGEGPGETREPVDLTIMPDGNLGILQRFPGKIVRIDLMGTPLGDIVLGNPEDGGFHSAYTGRCKNGHLMILGQSATTEGTIQTRTWWLASYDAEGNERNRPWSDDLIIDFAKPVIDEETILHPAMFASTPGPDGCFYVADDRAEYAIDVYDPDGRFIRQVALVCEGNPLDDKLFWARDDMVVIVKGAVPAMFASMAGGSVADEDEEEETDDMEVVCYRVPN